MKRLIASFALLASACVFGAIDDTIVVVSTQGPDKYADGTVVLDGERYALVWSADEFAGFNADGTLVNGDDAVLGVFSRAKDGACPEFAFPVAARYVRQGGVLSLWLLDTRVYGADDKVSFAKTTGPSGVEAVTAAAAVEAKIDFRKAGGMSIGSSESVQAQPGSVVVPANVPQPKICGMTTDENFVYVEVEGTVPYIRYDISAGDSPDALKPGAAKANPSGDASGKITLIAPKQGGSGFFKVGGK